MKISSGNITELLPNQIFVFGSNEASRHGAGAAKQAIKWGAKYGIGVGLSGQTYAIPTKDKNIKTLSIGKIEKYVNQFIEFTKTRRDLDFLVTEIGCGLSGYKIEDIAPLFVDSLDLDNVYLPQRFVDNLYLLLSDF